MPALVDGASYARTSWAASLLCETAPSLCSSSSASAAAAPYAALEWARSRADVTRFLQSFDELRELLILSAADAAAAMAAAAAAASESGTDTPAPALPPGASATPSSYTSAATPYSANGSTTPPASHSPAANSCAVPFPPTELCPGADAPTVLAISTGVAASPARAAALPPTTPSQHPSPASSANGSAAFPTSPPMARRPPPVVVPPLPAVLPGRIEPTVAAAAASSQLPASAGGGDANFNRTSSLGSAHAAFHLDAPASLGAHRAAGTASNAGVRAPSGLVVSPTTPGHNSTAATHRALSTSADTPTPTGSASASASGALADDESTGSTSQALGPAGFFAAAPDSAAGPGPPPLISPVARGAGGSGRSGVPSARRYLVSSAAIPPPPASGLPPAGERAATPPPAIPVPAPASASAATPGEDTSFEDPTPISMSEEVSTSAVWPLPPVTRPGAIVPEPSPGSPLPDQADADLLRVQRGRRRPPPLPPQPQPQPKPQQPSTLAPDVDHEFRHALAPTALPKLSDAAAGGTQPPQQQGDSPTARPQRHRGSDPDDEFGIAQLDGRRPTRAAPRQVPPLAARAVLFGSASTGSIIPTQPLPSAFPPPPPDSRPPLRDSSPQGMAPLDAHHSAAAAAVAANAVTPPSLFAATDANDDEGGAGGDVVLMGRRGPASPGAGSEHADFGGVASGTATAEGLVDEAHASTNVMPRVRHSVATVPAASGPTPPPPPRSSRRSLFTMRQRLRRIAGSASTLLSSPRHSVASLPGGPPASPSRWSGHDAATDAEHGSEAGDGDEGRVAGASPASHRMRVCVPLGSGLHDRDASSDDGGGGQPSARALLLDAVAVAASNADASLLLRNHGGLAAPGELGGTGGDADGDATDDDVDFTPTLAGSSSGPMGDYAEAAQVALLIELSPADQPFTIVCSTGKAAQECPFELAVRSDRPVELTPLPLRSWVTHRAALQVRALTPSRARMHLHVAPLLSLRRQHAISAA